MALAEAALGWSAYGGEAEARFTCVRIIGGGLIGASLAEALRRSEPSLGIALADPSQDVRAQARLSGLFSEGVYASVQELPFAEGAVYVIAAPLSAFPGIFGALNTSLGRAASEGRCSVTDAGSVKGYVRDQARLHAPMLLSAFTGAHPVAGKASDGFISRDGTLFSGRRAVLCPGRSVFPGALASARALWRAAGCETETMTPDEHDSVYAVVSHLPQLLMFAMRRLLREKGLEPLFAVKERRYARLFGSPPALWYDIFAANARALGEALREYAAVSLQGLDGAMCGGARPFTDRSALCAADMVLRYGSEPSGAYPCFLFEYLVTGALAHVAADRRRYGGPAFADLMRAAAAGAGEDAPLRDELPCAASLPRLLALAEALFACAERGDAAGYLELAA